MSNTKPLSTLENSEIDRIAAEEIMQWKLSEYGGYWEGNEDEDGVKLHTYQPQYIGDPTDDMEWCPTNSASNQCDLYLFPRLAKPYSIHSSLSDNEYFSIKITVPNEDWKVIKYVEHSGKGIDQINRTKTICAIEAMRKLRRSDG